MLTSGSRYFVDIRLWIKALEEIKSHSGCDDYEGYSGEVLDWAFCGTSRSTPASAGGGSSKPQHCVWDHWIDSRSATPAPDEGDLIPQANGDELERGWQKHPETGQQVEYEELWGNVDVLPIKPLGSDQSVQSCIVLRHEKANESRGLVVQVGQYIQGMMKSPGGIRLERYEWRASPGSEVGKGVWERTSGLGVGRLPCRRIIKGLGISTGETLSVGDDQWEVLEDFTW